MATLVVLRAVVSLRIITLLTLTASLLVMGLNRFTDDDASKVNFTDLLSYRYVFGCGAVGFLYTLMQIPFAIYNVVKQKRLIRNGYLPEFDFFADQVIALVLASGVGAGMAVSFELKRALGESFNDESQRYLNRGIISTAILLVGVLFMLLLIAISSNRRRSAGLFK